MNDTMELLPLNKLEKKFSITPYMSALKHGL